MYSVSYTKLHPNQTVKHLKYGQNTNHAFLAVTFTKVIMLQ
jgi:hypothetical protein